MFFFFRKPTVTIDAFVPDEYAFAVEYAPIQKASKFLPKWFKDLPSPNIQNYLKCPIDNYLNVNVKGCPGIVNALFNGFIVPTWCDLRIDWDKEKYEYQFSDQISSIKHHFNEQITGFGDNYIFLKVCSPWIVKFSKSLNVAHLPLNYYYGMDYPLKTLFGIQPTLSRHNAIFVNQFFMLQQQTEGSELIPHNSPLVHLQPPLEYNYKINCHVDNKECNKLQNLLLPKVSFYRMFMKKVLLEKKRSI